MTTPDKEEMPTEDRTAGPWIVHYGEAVKIKDANGYTVASLSQIHLHGRRSKNEVEKTARFIVIACNAYEPMREALAFYAAPENHGLQQHGLCFASAVDIDEGERARAALSTLPVNDRHHSGSDSYQADAGAPALSEKVITAAEWLPIESAPKDGRSILIGGGSYSYSGETFPEDRPFEQVAKAAYVDGEWFGGFGSEYDEKYSHSPTHWMPLPSPPGAEVTISNDAERDAVSLKPDTSSQPASEAGKLSTDEVAK